MKVTKRLFNSIVCLIVSLAVCVWAVYAWFAQNDKVSSNGANTGVTTPDLLDFDVTAYYLDYNGTNTDEYKKAESGNIPGSFDKTVDNANGKGELGTLDVFESSSDQMRPYDSLRPYSTAVLFEIKYKIKSGSEKDFRIYANCPYAISNMPENVFTVVEDTTAEDAFVSSVSNCVFMNVATQTESVYTYNSTNNETFIKEDDTKNFTKYLAYSTEGGIAKDGQEHTLNVIVDYDAELFTKLSTYMLSAGGSLNSSLTFLGDLSFGIEDYDSSEILTVESIQLVECTSTAVYVKGETVTPDWKFLLTYSDGTLETVKYNAEEFTIDGSIDVSSAGENSVTVSYNGVQGEVNYVVAEAYTVTFATTNSVEATMPVAQTVQKDKTATKPNDPKATGYTFVGWYTDEDCISEFDFSTPITEDITLYAKWIEATEYKVTFDMNGHGAQIAQMTTVGGKITAPTAPTATGYDFGGWFDNSTCTGTAIDFTNKVFTTDTTVYAKWSAISYTVTYMDGETEMTGLIPSTYTIESTANLPMPSKTGYSFAGWFTASTGGEQVTSLTGKTENLILYAHWTESSGTTDEFISTKVSSASSGDEIYNGNLFGLVANSNFTLAANYSTATADDDSSLSFTQGLLPNGGGASVTITAKENITFKIYYVASDSGFSTKDQSKSGNLQWSINGGTTKTSTKTDSKSNMVAYSEVITLNKGDVCLLSLTSNRFVLYAIYAELTT